MDSLMILAQAPVTIGTGEILGDILKLGFATVVAWYLITKTTSAIQEVAVELAKLRGEIESTRADLRHEMAEVRRDVRTLDSEYQEPKGR